MKKVKVLLILSSPSTNLHHSRMEYSGLRKNRWGGGRDNGGNSKLLNT